MIYALEIKGLRVEIKSEEERILPVSDFTICAKKGEITGIIGESGAGKSMSMKAVLGILPGNARMECTKMRLNGKVYKPEENAGRIAWIPQNPSAALDPVSRIGAQMTEILRVHKKCRQKEANEWAGELLLAAGLLEPKKCMRQYPFELSGGMCQRVAAAAALASEPQVLIADEPTASLDIRTQRKVLDFLGQWAREQETAVVMVSHDLAAARDVCSEINVMQNGKIVESGSTENIFEHPVHPYTRLLTQSISKSAETTEVSMCRN